MRGDKISRKVFHLRDMKHLCGNFKENRISNKVFLLSDTKYLTDDFREMVKSHSTLSMRYEIFMG